MIDSGKSSPRKKERFSEEMIRECLAIMESGDIEDLFEIIPRIGVLRDSRFYEPLLKLLSHKDVKRREFAAYAMGALRDRAFLAPLKQAFTESKRLKGFGARGLQIAIIEAIGSIGDDAAVDFFLPALSNCCTEMASAEGKNAGKIAGQMAKWIIESLGAIAQQGGGRSLKALIELLDHDDPEIQSLAVSELSVSYWHRPNEIEDSTLQKICNLTSNDESLVAESALSALQNLADVGCFRAEELFEPREED